jgi:hypothetical protein
MIPTPEQVIPLVVPAVPDLRDAIRAGIDYADDVQPDLDERDPWYWSHSARWKARNSLRDIEDPEGWSLTPDIPNCGIHVRIGDLHEARVLRSLDGTTPHPGSNRRRRRAWTGVQGQFLLADGELPPLSLIIDWCARKGEPEIHVGLPAGPWEYGNAALHWRVALPEGGTDLKDLRFEPKPDPGLDLVDLTIDSAESGEG